MIVQESTEQVAPSVVAPGDVIEDPAAPRWLTVTQVRTSAGANGGLFHFFGNGPDDRITFEGIDAVTRRRAP
ncbi:MAG: hypothetical protein JWP55_1259 [Mycobacterium sp.]|nr:hypothetical protein [Mycobacterium sp.]